MPQETPAKNAADHTLATTLAFSALQELAAQGGYSEAVFSVSPTLSADKPETLRGFEKLAQALLGAYKKGQASAQARYVLHSSSDGDWSRLSVVNKDGSETIVSEGHSFNRNTLRELLAHQGCSVEEIEHPPEYFE